MNSNSNYCMEQTLPAHFFAMSRSRTTHDYLARKSYIFLAWILIKLKLQLNCSKLHMILSLQNENVRLM